MSRVRRKNARINKKQPKIESKFRWCPIRKLRYAKVICEERCMNMKCSVVRKKIEEQRKKELKKEEKKFNKKGITRNLLLKPEDRKDGNKKRKG